MKVKDVFDEIFVGINLSAYSKTEDRQEVLTFNKDNIIHNSILYNDVGYNKFNMKMTYNHLPDNLVKIKVPRDIKEKYFLRFRDIIISKRRPYKVFNDILVKDDKIIANNNYIILRGMKKLYDEEYLKYYIEKVGIKRLIENSSIIINELSIEDIKDIELPNIPISEQRKISTRINNLTREILEAEEEIEKIINFD